MRTPVSRTLSSGGGMCVFITDIVYYPNKNTDAFKPVQAGQRDLSNQALFAALFKHDNQFSVPLFRIISSAAILNASAFARSSPPSSASTPARPFKGHTMRLLRGGEEFELKTSAHSDTPHPA